MPTPGRVLVVGGGPTAAAFTAMARTRLPDMQTVIWEAEAGLGGRMATLSVTSKRGAPDEITRPAGLQSWSEKHRLAALKEEGLQPEQLARVDVGAQYISVGERWHTQEVKSILKCLKDEKVLQPFVGKIHGARPGHELQEHLVAPSGMSSVPAFLIRKNATEVQCHRRVKRVDASDSASRPGWVVCDESGNSESFDAIVLTIPVPSILLLEGSIQNVLAPLRESLKSVLYSRRFALALYYKPSASSVLRSYTRKRGSVEHCADGDSPTILLHSSIDFAAINAGEPRDEIKQAMLDRLSTVMGTTQLPKPQRARLVEWSVSQVLSPLPPTEHTGAIRLDGPAPMLLAGDYFTESRFDACVVSASKALDLLTSDENVVPA